MESESGAPDPRGDDSWVGWDRLCSTAVEDEGKETFVVDVVDVGKASGMSWRLLFGGNWVRGACWLVGEGEQRVEVVWHMDSEDCCWAEMTGWDSCTGVGRSSSGSVEAQGRGEEEETGDAEEESGVKEYNTVSCVGGLWPASMLLSLMSTAIAL